jgi:hypothetical protein
MLLFFCGLRLFLFQPSLAFQLIDRMKQFRIYFDECEHSGDLNNYKGDLVKSGARIVAVNPNYDSEDAIILVEVKDKEDFDEKFSATESFDFATY